MQKEEEKLYVIEKIVEPDHELLVWEKWIKIRKEETLKLSKQTQRPPTDLVMNLSENQRPDKERKIVLENAQIPKKPTLRGFSWEQPQRLTQGCYCEPVYEIHRTLTELGRPQVIEHIGVPQYIQEKEKGLTGAPERPEFTKINAEYEKYRVKREADLKARIKKIDPHRSEIKDLIVIGSRPKTPPKKLPPLPEIIVTPPTFPVEDGLSNVYSIRINNTIIIKDVRGQTLTHLPKMRQEAEWNEECNSWTYYFNAPMKRMGRSKVFLQNLGTVALRYCWKKIKNNLPFIPEDIYEQVFFFNKNEDVLFPGQCKEIFFTFLSEKPGIYSEFWELYMCNICFFDAISNKLLFNFYGDSIENTERIMRKSDILKARIDRKAITNIVTHLIEELVVKSMAIEPRTYAYQKYFLEAELFVMKNPVCFYHQTEVLKMRDTFKEMEPNEEWNMSIGRWREVMMSKEYEDRMRYFDVLKTSHSELLKPWYEDKDVAKQKYNTIRILLGQLFDKFDQVYDRLVNEHKPEEPSFIPPPSKSKHSVVSMPKSFVLDPMVKYKIRCLFFLYIYEHMANTMELCAGVLSSIDLNRWIDFDFCRW